MSLVRSAVSRYQEDGISGVYSGVRSLLELKLHQKYWMYQGAKSISCNDHSATFRIRSSEEFHAIDYFVNNEMSVLSDVITELRGGDAFYDIGANIGIYSIFAALCGANTIAIEPYPPNVYKLQSNISQNEVDVRVIESALGADEGTTQLSSPSGDQIGSIGINTSGSGAKTDLRTLDNIIMEEEYFQPDVMKIDVEGAEGLVLDGSHDALQQCRVVYLELHHNNAFGVSTTDYGYTPDEVLDVLNNRGFEMSKIIEKDGQDIIKATRSK